MTDVGRLDANRVRALFQELSDRLAAAGVQAQLFVVGGAAMALAYDTGRLTRDVDALFVPTPEVRQTPPPKSASTCSPPHIQRVGSCTATATSPTRSPPAPAATKTTAPRATGSNDHYATFSEVVP
jgi:hypothetical protein